MPMMAAATPEEEFAKINQQRSSRASAIEIIKAEKLAAETKNGTLQAISKASDKTKAAIEAENKDRLRQFSIIANKRNMSAESIALAFATQMGVDVDKKELETILRIHGSNTVGASLAPELVVNFLKSRGLSDIVIDKKGVETFISFKRPSKKALGLIEIKAHGSSTAFDETSSTKNVGLAGGFCDLGMASRPIKDKEADKLKKLGYGDLKSLSSEYPIALDGVAVILNARNPIGKLSVQQIADVFSGEIKNWKELGGNDSEIKIFARDEQSGTWDTFKSRVLKPFKYKLATTNVERFEDSSKLVRSVSSEPGGIGFCGLAYVDTSVKGLAVKATEGLTAFQPTRLTVKTQDYPLSRLLYFYLPNNAPQFSYDFVKYTMSNAGQKVVDEVGLIGQGLSTAKDFSNADAYKESLLNDLKVPKQYKNLIRNANRRESQASIRFASGSNDPDTNSINNLNRLANFLAESGNENKKVILIGFTDTTGSAAGNLKLSKKRASSVGQILKSKGVRNITTEGLGEIMPVADNKSEKQRQRNRRVEVWLSE